MKPMAGARFTLSQESEKAVGGMQGEVGVEKGALQISQSAGCRRAIQQNPTKSDKIRQNPTLAKKSTAR
jgi:hypothetical protein